MVVVMEGIAKKHHPLADLCSLPIELRWQPNTQHRQTDTSTGRKKRMSNLCVQDCLLHSTVVSDDLGKEVNT